MFSGLFQSTTIPVLEQVVGFTQSRHNVLAGNIANMDTPGYQARDLDVADFEKRLKTAIDQRDAPVETSPGMGDAPRTDMAQVAKDTKSIMMHDGSNVGMEHQVSEMVKNQMKHDMALQIMVQQFRQLQTAISGRL